MKKKLTKKSVSDKWATIIKDRKQHYDNIRSTNENLPPFYKTEQYKDLNGRRNRALKNYDNREAINAERREKYRLEKEAEKQRDEYTKLSDVTVWEAFSGVGRVFENGLRKSVKELNSSFYGEVTINGREIRFVDITKYIMYINKILAKLYGKTRKLDSDKIFLWRVSRSYMIDLEKNQTFSNHVFYKSDSDPDDEEEPEDYF